MAGDAAQHHEPPQSGTRRSTGAVRVLIVGPFNTGGGLARMVCLSAGGLDADRFDLATCETAKDTPPDRSLTAACRSHLRRWSRLVGAIRRHQPHVVHLHTCSYHTFHRTLLDVWTCQAMRRPYVLHIHGGLFAEFLSRSRGLRRRAIVAALRGAGRVIVLSEAWRTTLTRQVAGLNIAVIGNAVDDGPVADDHPERGCGVLFVGDLSEPKRPEDLIVAYAALPTALRGRFPLTLVGGGEASRHQRLRDLVDRLGVTDAVKFTGTLTHERIQELMRMSDLLALPSRAEGMPLVVLEAMRAALPIVATRVGAVPEMIDDGIEGYVVEPLDTDALAKAMKRLLEDSARRQLCGRAARRRVEHRYSIQSFRTALRDVWAAEATAAVSAERTLMPKLASSTFRSIL